jgi:hypothetical protein
LEPTQSQVRKRLECISGTRDVIRSFIYGQTDRQAGRKAGRKAGMPAGRQGNSQREWERARKRWRDGDVERLRETPIYTIHVLSLSQTYQFPFGVFADFAYLTAYLVPIKSLIPKI